MNVTIKFYHREMKVTGKVHKGLKEAKSFGRMKTQLPPAVWAS